MHLRSSDDSVALAASAPRAWATTFDGNAHAIAQAARREVGRRNLGARVAAALGAG